MLSSKDVNHKNLTPNLTFSQVALPHNASSYDEVNLTHIRSSHVITVVLCLIGVANPETIQQNIENLKKRSAKKLVAQALYYGTEGKSPLARDVLDDDFNKPPVHERLGLKRQNRVPVLGTNTSFIGPKKRDFRKIATNRTFRQTGSAKFATVDS